MLHLNACRWKCTGDFKLNVVVRAWALLLNVGWVNLN